MARNEELFNLLLLRENVDLNARTLEEHTPLYFALISTRKLINTNSFAARLVEKGADANPVKRYYYACNFRCSDFYLIVNIYDFFHRYTIEVLTLCYILSLMIV